MQCSGASVLLWLWVMTWVLLRACELIRRIFLSTHRADPLTLETDLNAAANRMASLMRPNETNSKLNLGTLARRKVQIVPEPQYPKVRVGGDFFRGSCLGCGVSPLSHRELICSFRFGRHVFGDRARTKVPGHATPSFGFDMDARDLVLQDWSNNEIVRCLEGSSTAVATCLFGVPRITRKVVSGRIDSNSGTVWSTSRILLRMSPAACVINAFRL